MNVVWHGIKESYKQLGRNTFCCAFLALGYCVAAIGFSFGSLNILGLSVSSLLWLCAGISAFLFTASYVGHYIFLFKVYLQNTETGEIKLIKHSSRFIEIPGWRPHRLDGPAITGFDVHNEADFELYFFEGSGLSKEIFEKIAFAKVKGDLNEFLTSPEEVQRQFAKHKMKNF